MHIKLLFCTLIVFQSSFTRYDSSWPYLSGDTFRAFCKFKIDETNGAIQTDKIELGDTIYVHPLALEYFFSKIHPFIKAQYILVSHNDDMSVPGKFEKYLKDFQLAAWFGENATLKHPKITPIPLGIMNETLTDWCQNAIGRVPGHRITLEKILFNLKPIQEKKFLLYMNFDIYSNTQERKIVQVLFSNKPYCHKSGRKPLNLYLLDLAHSKFVLSPAGGGIDCVRIWEALYMGSYPIVKTSKLDPLYTDLPVVIIKNWQQLTKDFLQKKYIEMKSKKYNYKKLYAPYWLKLIRAQQAKIRKQNNAQA